jgi:hypothetical protein
MGPAMLVWKRWSWRYRIGVLFALLLLLQGATCPLDLFQRTTVAVPEVGNVIVEYFWDGPANGYFLVEQIDRNGARGFRRVYYPSREYVLIIATFRQRGDYVPGQWWNSPSSIPGAAGTLPAPPVQ